MHNLLLADVPINSLWYAIPLIIVVSAVYAATRHERMGPILFRGLGCGLMIAGFMALILVLLFLLSWTT